jgi:kynurenine formamidase
VNRSLSSSTSSESDVDLVSKLKSAKVYDLGQPYFWGMPVHPADPPFLIYLYRYHEHTARLFESVAPGLGFADSLELVSTSMHSGTHIDALCHMSRNGKLYGGVSAAELETHVGYTSMGVEEVPIMIKRGVLLDIPSYLGTDILPERYEIGSSDIDGAIRKQGVEVRPGDAVMVRTGYSKFLTTDPEKYLHKFAGVTAKGARHLAAMRIAVACSDNLAFGVPKPFELHQVFLVDHGIYMIKSMNLDELARDRAYTTVLFVAPLKIKGATGSLVRPFALLGS